MVAERVARRPRVVRARHTARRFARRTARPEPSVGTPGRADSRPKPDPDRFLDYPGHHPADQWPGTPRSFQPRWGDHDDERRQHRKHLRRRSNGSGALLPTALRAASVGTADQRVFRIGSRRPTRGSGFDHVVGRQRLWLRSSSGRRVRVRVRHDFGWIGVDVLFGWFAPLIGWHRGNHVVGRQRRWLRSASGRRIGVRLRLRLRHNLGWIGDDALFEWYSSLIGWHPGNHVVAEWAGRNGSHALEPMRCRAAIADASIGASGAPPLHSRDRGPVEFGSASVTLGWLAADDGTSECASSWGGPISVTASDS